MDRLIDVRTLKDLEEIRAIMLSCGMNDVRLRIYKIIHDAGVNELISNYEAEQLEPEDEYSQRRYDAFVFQSLMENVDDYLSDVMQTAEINKAAIAVLRELCTQRAKEDEAALNSEYERDLL